LGGYSEENEVSLGVHEIKEKGLKGRRRKKRKKRRPRGIPKKMRRPTPFKKSTPSDV